MWFSPAVGESGGAIKGEVSCEVVASAKRPCKGCFGSAIHKEGTWKCGHCVVEILHYVDS